MRNRQSEWARVLLSSLADAGVRQVVVSPGSRSTPFLLAALAEKRLRCRTLIDERSAAFFALGQSKMTGAPSLLLCTSGSAAANYLPAVVEARASGTPLLILTSDRPMELSDCGANQAIDQVKLFGGHAVGYFDLAHPDASEAALLGLRRMAAQAFFRSRYPVPGPVQLNARARTPLEPGSASSEEEKDLCRRRDDLLGRPIARPIRPRLEPDPGAIKEMADRCGDEEQGLIVCGPAPLGQESLQPLLVELGERTAFPILAEGASQIRFQPRRAESLFVDGFDLLLRSRSAKSWRPRLILRVAAFPTASSWGSLLSAPGAAECWVLAEHGWNDPTNRAAVLLTAEPRLAIEALLRQLDSAPRPPGAWAEGLRSQEELAWQAVDQVLAEGDGLSEGWVARELLRCLPEGGLLAVGNSLPIRHLDRYCPGGGSGLGVWSQRGASGIDGLLSGAAGAASAGGGTAALLVGDVSFLHDLGGLAALAFLEAPFIVVVLNNDGGRLFEELPLAKHPAAEGIFDSWLTPHGLSVAPAAQMHSLAYARVDSREGLREALHRALNLPGATIVEAVVPPNGAALMWGEIKRRFDNLLVAG